MAAKLPLIHSLHLPTAEAHLGPGGIWTCCQHVVVTALMAWVILTDMMGKQTWQNLTQPLYLVFTQHCSTDNKEPQTSEVRWGSARLLGVFTLFRKHRLHLTSLINTCEYDGTNMFQISWDKGNRSWWKMLNAANAPLWKQLILFIMKGTSAMATSLPWPLG